LLAPSFCGLFAWEASVSGTISSSVSDLLSRVDQFEFWQRLGTALLILLTVFAVYRVLVHFVLEPAGRRYERIVHSPDDETAAARRRALLWSVLLTWLALSVGTYSLSGMAIAFPALAFGIWWLYALAIWIGKLLERVIFSRPSVGSVVISYVVAFVVLGLVSIWVTFQVFG
jgi:hypothetical protein